MNTSIHRPEYVPPEPGRDILPFVAYPAAGIGAVLLGFYSVKEIKKCLDTRMSNETCSKVCSIFLNTVFGGLAGFFFKFSVMKADAKDSTLGLWFGGALVFISSLYGTYHKPKEK